MTLQRLDYTKEESSQRGRELYEHHIRSQVEAGNYGKIVAIDLDTGAFEIADDTMTASDRLLDRYPDAQIWRIRIGFQAVHRFGGMRLS